MAKIITPFLLAVLLTGCFEAQRALGCNDTGILGCKDEPSDIQPPDPELRPAPSGGRSLPRPNPREQAPEVTASGCLEHHQYPWSQQRRELENSPLFGVEPNGPNT